MSVSIANALEILQCCIKPLMWFRDFTTGPSACMVEHSRTSLERPPLSGLKWEVVCHEVWYKHDFLPKACFGLQVLSLSAFVCVCQCVRVCQPQGCPCNNSSLIRYAWFGHQIKYTTTRVNTKVIYDSLQCLQRRVCLVLQSLRTQF